jgi:hypothetical protein
MGALGADIGPASSAWSGSRREKMQVRPVGLVHHHRHIVIVHDIDDPAQIVATP